MQCRLRPYGNEIQRIGVGMDASSLNTRLSQRKIQKICVIKPSALGDVVQSLPILPVLRQRFPESHISWVINRELSDLLTGNSCLDELIPFDRKGGVSAWWKLLKRLRRAQFDLVIDLQGLLRTGIMTLATRAPIRIGLQTAREGSHLACHELLRDSSNQVPAYRRTWRLAEELGLGELRPHTEIVIPDYDRQWARQLRASLQGPLLVIQPGARWQTKQWPIRHYAEVARRAMKELGLSAIIIGSPGEYAAAQELLELVKHSAPRGEILSLAGQTTIKQLAVLIQHADLVLSNDSGPLHLAAGLGTPVVGVFTCTSPIRSGPAPAPLRRMVATQLPCAASYCKKCPNLGSAHLACFKELSPDRVWEGVAQTWAEIQRQRSRAA